MKTIIFALIMAFSSVTFAATKCERMPDGSACCWDTQKEGPFRPLSCG